LEDHLKRPVDLITETSLKNPYFIEEVNETKMKIYG
jgi:predicted nucleotidyltransferase